jgi:hypothetical protein
VLRHAGFGQTSVREAAKEEISRDWTLRRVGFELLEKIFTLSGTYPPHGRDD